MTAPISTFERSPEPQAAGDKLGQTAGAVQIEVVRALRQGLEHELRSPLHGIVLNVELLRELLRADAGAGLERHLECLNKITTAIERLQSGLADLLDLTDELDEKPARFELAEVVREAAGLLHAQARQHGLSVELEAEGGHFPVTARRRAVRLAVLAVAIDLLSQLDEGGLRLTVAAKPSAVEVEFSRSAHVAAANKATRYTGFARQLLEAEGGELEAGADGVAKLRFPEAES